LNNISQSYRKTYFISTQSVKN